MVSKYMGFSRQRRKDHCPKRSTMTILFESTTEEELQGISWMRVGAKKAPHLSHIKTVLRQTRAAKGRQDAEGSFSILPEAIACSRNLF